MTNDRTAAATIPADAVVEQLGDSYGYFCRGGRLLESGRSRFQHYEIWDTPAFGKLFRLDGSFMSAERDEFFYHENLVHVPALSLPAPPRRALVIGGGDGGSARELLKYPAIERVVVVELDEAVVALARRHLAAIHGGAFEDTRTELRFENGLDYVSRHAGDTGGARFDLVVLDLTGPAGPAAALYEPPFFRACQTLLGGQGLLSLHLGAPVFQREQVRAVVDGLKAVFANVSPYFLYIPLYGSLWGLACASDCHDPRKFAASTIDRRVHERGIGALRYYNGDMHVAQFAQPNYLRALLG